MGDTAETGGAPSFLLDSSTASSLEEAYWTWRDAVSAMFDVSVDDAAAVDAFRFRVASYHLGPLLVGSVGSVGQQFRRSPATIARSGIDHYLVQLYERGGYAGEAEGIDVRVEPGDISVLDMSRTLATEAEEFLNISVVVPRPVLAPLLKTPDGLHGTVLPGRSALGSLLGNYMRSICATAGALTPEEGAGITEATAGLIAGCLGPSADARGEADRGRGHATQLAIRQYIDRNLASPDLTVGRIAREFGVSRATLGRMFEPLGGLGGYIRDRRLFRCFAEITSSARGAARGYRTIGELAYEWGFGNEASFSRAFRRAFDMSPREARAAAADARRMVLQRPPGARGPGGQVLTDWIRHLRG